MEQATTKFEFIEEVKSRITGEDVFYYTLKDKVFVQGSLSYNKEEAHRYFLMLVSGDVKDTISKTIIESVETKAKMS
jgi:hypothetical protein